jgi:hypothetical protein
MIAYRISCFEATWLYKPGALTPSTTAMSYMDVPR